MKKLLYFLDKWPTRNNSSHDNLFFSVVGSFINRSYNPIIVSQDQMNPQSSQELEEYTIHIHQAPANESLKLKMDSSGLELAVFNSAEASRQFSCDVYNKYNKVPQILFLRSLGALLEYRKQMALGSDQLIRKQI